MRSRPVFDEIRKRGTPVALVAQDGMEHLELPWDEFDWLFVGGTTDFKLGPGLEVARRARERGLKTHMGRVNGRRRFRLARDEGFDSVDGTYLRFHDTYIERVISWLNDQ